MKRIEEIKVVFYLFFFILFLNLKHCISFAKHQNESASGIHVLPLQNLGHSVSMVLMGLAFENMIMDPFLSTVCDLVAEVPKAARMLLTLGTVLLLSHWLPPPPLSLTPHLLPPAFPTLFSVVVVQSPSRVQLFVTLWTAAHQASLSLTISWNFPNFMLIALVMLFSHLIL